MEMAAKSGLEYGYSEEHTKSLSRLVFCVNFTSGYLPDSFEMKFVKKSLVCSLFRSLR